MELNLYFIPTEGFKSKLWRRNRGLKKFTAVDSQPWLNMDGFEEDCLNKVTSDV